MPEPVAPAPRTRAEKLEAKAVRLRQKDEAARARAAEALPRRSRWVRIVLPSVAGALVVGLAAALIWTLVLLDQRDGDVAAANRIDAARASALKAALTYAVDFGSYDYQHLDADFQRVTEHLTAGFAKKYSSVSRDLRAVIVQYKGRSTATVQGAAISSVTSTHAVAVIFLDQTVITTQSKTPRIDRNRMQMTMQRQGNGDWMISDLALK